MIDKSFIYIGAHLIEIGGLILAYFSLIIPIRQYLGQKNIEEKDKRFNNYHRLIKELVSPNSPTEATYMDRQIAVVFELRNYPEYYEVSKRILEGLKDVWSPHGQNFRRLMEEIDLSLDYIQNKL